MLKTTIVPVLIFSAATFIALPAGAQLQNPIQAAKDAYNKAKQQQKQGQSSPQPAAQPAATPASTPTGTPNQPTSAEPAPAPGPSASTGPAQGNSVPAPPAGSLDPSKLPDVEGIHLGMSVEQATTIMKSLFPSGTHTLTMTASRFMNTSDKPWLTSMTGSLASNCTGCSEQVILRFSAPPNPQQVISIQRAIVFEAGKQPTMDATMAGLRQKYGHESSKSVPDPVQSLAWFFDEQGRQLPASPGFQPGCAGGMIGPPPGGDMSHPNAVGFVLPTSPITPNAIAAMMRDPCRSNVYLRVELSPTGPGLVHIINILMSENALDTRDVIAAQQYLDAVATGQKQQQLKNAQQQAAPSL